MQKQITYTSFAQEKIMACYQRICFSFFDWFYDKYDALTFKGIPSATWG
jgi:hypothetical protein